MPSHLIDNLVSMTSLEPFLGFTGKTQGDELEIPECFRQLSVMKPVKISYWRQRQSGGRDRMLVEEEKKRQTNQFLNSKTDL